MDELAFYIVSHVRRDEQDIISKIDAFVQSAPVVGDPAERVETRLCEATKLRFETGRVHATLLHCACTRGYTTVAKYLCGLCSTKRFLDMQMDDHATALWLACALPDDDVACELAEFLVSCGACPAVRRVSVGTRPIASLPLYIACEIGNVKTAQYMMRATARIYRAWIADGTLPFESSFFTWSLAGPWSLLLAVADSWASVSARIALCEWLLSEECRFAWPDTSDNSSLVNYTVPPGRDVLDVAMTFVSRSVESLDFVKYARQLPLRQLDANVLYERIANLHCTLWMRRENAKDHFKNVIECVEWMYACASKHPGFDENLQIHTDIVSLFACWFENCEFTGADFECADAVVQLLHKLARLYPRVVAPALERAKDTMRTTYERSWSIGVLSTRPSNTSIAVLLGVAPLSLHDLHVLLSDYVHIDLRVIKEYMCRYTHFKGPFVGLHARLQSTATHDNDTRRVCSETGCLVLSKLLQSENSDLAEIFVAHLNPFPRQLVGMWVKYRFPESVHRNSLSDSHVLERMTVQENLFWMWAIKTQVLGMRLSQLRSVLLCAHKSLVLETYVCVARCCTGRVDELYGCCFTDEMLRIFIWHSTTSAYALLVRHCRCVHEAHLSRKSVEDLDEEQLHKQVAYSSECLQKAHIIGQHFAIRKMLKIVDSRGNLSATGQVSVGNGRVLPDRAARLVLSF